VRRGERRRVDPRLAAGPFDGIGEGGRGGLLEHGPDARGEVAERAERRHRVEAPDLLKRREPERAGAGAGEAEGAVRSVLGDWKPGGAAPELGPPHGEGGTEKEEPLAGRSRGHGAEAAEPRPPQQVQEDGLGAVVGRVREQHAAAALAPGHREERGVARAPSRLLPAAFHGESRPEKRHPERAGRRLHRLALLSRGAFPPQSVVAVAERDVRSGERGGEPDGVGPAGKGEKKPPLRERVHMASIP